ncbi:hypothetical protein UFOVP1357_24 [uncultured Caudovirales phage]|uniref:Uncharacterized protein n=1 Tax=uncultured Caudovirales phage TaxID=2100421 RepID=A0A6J5LEY8_9CAUD|nr:hypothetical protein UFOVP18_49 [uncultured Caudovirales phage]CAB4127077.1 hypothetical protein UFOVP82_51 [uncultured Caudovirales phage]CAB4132625.1 hypothetical protein UFOVP258_42 [uncultured Caudovirales phage]CAB4146519.1 hypothetical protein UFOVP502_34 [uncultured Caudovirales phage]CAB4200007.1 hypothetical protein UFOVP1357_24 [uncultured Caudovirales phage]
MYNTNPYGDNMDIQQDLFNNSPFDLLKEEVRMELKIVRDRSDNVRRGLFARHNELVKKQQSQDEKQDLMQRELDEMKAFVYGGLQKVG